MPEGVHKILPRAAMVTLEGPGVAIQVDTRLFSINTIFRACYKCTDRAYLFVGKLDGESLVVTLHPKAAGQDVTHLAGELANELIDQRLREDLARETAPVREMIVAEAFAEGNLLDESRDSGDYRVDPRKIGRHQ